MIIDCEQAFICAKSFLGCTVLYETIITFPQYIFLKTQIQLIIFTQSLGTIHTEFANSDSLDQVYILIIVLCVNFIVLHHYKLSLH